MFNIGPLELMVILLLALVVVGPSRLPEVGRSIGKGLRELRKVQDEVRDSINFDLDAEPKTPRPAPKPRTPRSSASRSGTAAPAGDDAVTPVTPIEPETPSAGPVSPGTPAGTDIPVETTSLPEPTGSSNGSTPAPEPPSAAPESPAEPEHE
jgi:sec-independent protein translocase protein TatA